MDKIKNLLLLVVAGIIIIFRFALDQTQFELLFVSAVTVISLLYVIFDIIVKVYRTKNEYYMSHNLPKIEVRRQKKRLQIASVSFTVAAIILSFLYIIFLKSNAINDALAIITLLISLEEASIIVVFTK